LPWTYPVATPWSFTNFTFPTKDPKQQFFNILLDSNQYPIVLTYEEFDLIFGKMLRKDYQKASVLKEHKEYVDIADTSFEAGQKNEPERIRPKQPKGVDMKMWRMPIYRMGWYAAEKEAVKEAHDKYKQNLERTGVFRRMKIKVDRYGFVEILTDDKMVRPKSMGRMKFLEKYGRRNIKDLSKLVKPPKEVKKAL
jgi:hypothetical protein